MKISSIVVLSMFLVSIASMGLIQSAEAAGAIEGEFKLGEVLDESVGWFIVVGLGMSLPESYLPRLRLKKNTWATCRVLKDSILQDESLKLV
tara:strand:- start:53 stop:328 length:276 start_codon:yes stop_codon:yes gene_type:complete